MKACRRGFGVVLLVTSWLRGDAALVAQSVEGTVLSSFTGTPIEAAELRLVNEEGRAVVTTLGDSDGQFWIRPPEPGAYFLHGQALGYFSLIEGPFELAVGDVLRVELVLRPAPLAVDSLAVEVEGRNPRLEATGFYRRLSSGQGFQMDREAISKRQSATAVSDLLSGIPGVSVGNSGEVSLRGMGSFRRCLYRVYLDGIEMVGPSSWDPTWPKTLIHPDHIEAVEVYRRPSEIPIQYAGTGGCGVILIWSRR